MDTQNKKPGHEFQHNKDAYQFLRIDKSGRVKALHVESGFRVSLPAHVLENS